MIDITEIISSSEFQILFPVIIPILVSLLAFIFLEPIVERLSLRQLISGKYPIIEIENIDELDKEGNILYHERMFRFVNKTERMIVIRKINFLFNRKLWGFRKYQEYEMKEVPPPYKFRLFSKIWFGLFSTDARCS